MSVELGLLALAAALGVALLLFGVPPAWVWPLVLLPYAARHLYHLLRLVRLIRRQHRLVPPFPRGPWGDI